MWHAVIELKLLEMCSNDEHCSLVTVPLHLSDTYHDLDMFVFFGRTLLMSVIVVSIMIIVERMRATQVVQARDVDSGRDLILKPPLDAMYEKHANGKHH